jgi:hypothetical protein
VVQLESTTRLPPRGWRLAAACTNGSISVFFMSDCRVCVFMSSPLSYTRVLDKRPPLGRAAALLARCPPPTSLSKPGPAVRCRSSPEFPFRFTWVLGWSTRYLWANDPTPCTCNTHYLRASSGCLGPGLVLSYTRHGGHGAGRTPRERRGGLGGRCGPAPPPPLYPGLTTDRCIS